MPTTSTPPPGLLAKITHILAVRRLPGGVVMPDSPDGAPPTAAQWLQSLNLLSTWIDAPLCLLDRQLRVVRGSTSLAARLPLAVGDGSGGRVSALLGAANSKCSGPIWNAR